MSLTRKLSTPDDEIASPQKIQKPAQKIPTGIIHVDLDESFSGDGSEAIYIDTNRVVYDASLEHDDGNKLGSKFYHLQLILGDESEYFVHARWGHHCMAGTSNTTKYVTLKSAKTDFESKL